MDTTAGAADRLAESDAQPISDPGPEIAISHDAALLSVLSLVSYTAQLFGRAVSTDEIREGLPLTRPQDRWALLPKLFERAHLSTLLGERPITAIPAAALPVVVILKTGDVALLTAKEKKTCRLIFFTGDMHKEATLSYKELQDDYSGHCLFVTPELEHSFASIEDEIELPESERMRWFWSPVRTMWSGFAQIVVAAFLINLFALASPLFIMNVYDRVIPNFAIPTLLALTIGVSIAILFDFLLKILRSRIVDETGRRIDMAISGQIFDKIITRRLDAPNATVSETVSHVREFDAVRDVLTSSTIIAITDAIFIGIFIAVLWVIVGPLALVPAVAVPVVIIATLVMRGPLNNAVAANLAHNAERQAVLIETVGNLEAVKTVGAGGWLRKKWDIAVARNSRSAAHARFWNNAATTFMSTVQQLVSVVIIVWGVFLVLDEAITVGALIAANILSGRVLAPLSNVSQTLARLAQARTAAHNISQLMVAESDLPAGGVDARLTPRAFSIALKDVEFHYPRSEIPAVTGLNIEISEGERVAIVGRIGSGKTTTTRLISGIYKPTTGNVTLGGVDTRQIGPAAMRRIVGFVSQEGELFSGTLRENIVAGSTNARDDDILRAITLSGVLAFAQNHPDGLNMMIAERGRNLSGGQRQAVALARTLIGQPKVLLLDEPTSSMDSATEAALIEVLRNFAAVDSTLILSTHRDALLALVDRLIVLDRGRVVHDGPKDQVIAAMRAQAQSRSARSTSA